MMAAACKDNETNQQQLLAVPEVAQRLLYLLEVKVKGQGKQIKSSCLSLLYEISLTEAGRVALVERMDLVRLILALFPLMKSSNRYNNTAAVVLNNIALEKQAKIALRNKIDGILPALEDLLSKGTAASIVGVACTTATNLAADVRIRNKMAANSSMWQALTKLVACYSATGQTQTLADVLGLCVNISSGVDTACLASLDVSTTTAAWGVLAKSSVSSAGSGEGSGGKATTHQGDGDQTSSHNSTDDDSSSSPAGEQSGEQERDITVRTLVLLSNILPVNSASVDVMSENHRAEKIVEFTKCQDCLIYKPALKCLSALTRSSHDVRLLVVENKGLSMLLSRLKDEDEAVAGNAALCLSHLTKDNTQLVGKHSDGKQTLAGSVCSRLVKTNIVQKLLTLARDG
ncbi:hypothetical protein EGW08_021548, partial [Elysia chlorotica]